MICKRFCKKLCPNSDKEKDLSGVKSACYLLIDRLILATLAWRISTTLKKTSKTVAYEFSTLADCLYELCSGELIETLAA